MHIDQTISGLGEGQGDTRGSQDRPVIIEEDEAEDTSSSRDADTGRVERDTSPHNALATSELASRSSTSISAPSFEKCLRQSSKPPQDQINQQDIGNAAQSTSVESAPPPHSLPKPSNTGDDGWTEDSMAELEEEMGLAIVEQAKSPPAGAPSSSHPPRSEESQDEIRSRQRSETAGSRLEEPRDGSRHATLDQDLGWEQRETRVVVEIVEEREQQEEVLAVEVASEAAKEEGEKERDDSNSEREQCGEKRRRQDKTSSSSQHFDTSDDEHDATWEEAGDEDTRPAKRRSPRRESTKNALIPAPKSPL
ncbi:hypothetical protein B0J14DRAFT_663176 [Halenospora varia]|nr:hypothetical protein B0J14DRAFT_663176 [Halenospora varia]